MSFNWAAFKDLDRSKKRKIQNLPKQITRLVKKLRTKYFLKVEPLVWASGSSVEYLQWYQHYQWTQVSPHFPKICFLDFQINLVKLEIGECLLKLLHSFGCYMVAMLLRLRMWLYRAQHAYLYIFYFWGGLKEISTHHFLLIHESK